MSRKICLNPTNALVTLDDDLYDTRYRENHVKILSARKADKKGHSTDTVSDALFRITRITLEVRFQKQGESQSSNVERLLDSLTEDQGQMFMYGLIVTADRGYGSIGLLKSLIGCSMGGVMILPDHLLRFQPIVGKSQFVSSSADEDINCDYHQIDVTSECSEDSGKENAATNGGETDGGATVNDFDAKIADYPATPIYDCRPLFVLNDDSNTGSCVNYARNAFKGTGHGHTRERKKEQVTAIAVREHGASE